MTPVEIALTVAVVVLAIGLLLLWRMAYCSRVDCAAIMTRAIFNRTDIDVLIKREQHARERAEKVEKVADKMHAMLDEFIKLAGRSEEKRDARLAAVEERQKELADQVAGIVISHVALTEPTFAGTTVEPSHNFFAPTIDAIQAAHAATDFDLQRPDIDPDDDQKTDVMATEMRFKAIEGQP